MPVCKNLAELEAYIQKKINETLMDEVATGVRETMQETIDEDVYRRYAPVKYVRRNELGNIENIKAELEGAGVLAVMNIAPPNNSVLGTAYTDYGGTSFARWVNDGLVPNIFNDKHYVWEDPAHFMEDTKDDLENSHTVKNKMKIGLTKRGLKVKG
ncbi:MAG: hypothetical protein PHR82_09055 [Endomicrobiaceae bacterium]|jgi:hypothetical protein|nr:hypothetical protein [Candidatus Gastranaerophilales bacterium]MDD5022257.1 hypothetical protein [Endomicrobiaceae bacterium]